VRRTATAEITTHAKSGNGFCEKTGIMPLANIGRDNTLALSAPHSAVQPEVRAMSWARFIPPGRPCLAAKNSPRFLRKNCRGVKHNYGWVNTLFAEPLSLLF